MEENKYYTPEIEEFHVGFEFEQVLEPWKIDKPQSKKWVKLKYNGNINSIGGPILSNTEELRVKYLDKEDIESLGFEQQINFAEYGVSTNEWKKGNYYLYKYDKKIIIKVNGDYDGEKPNFHGNIKNKSELKRLLKQLGII